MAKLFGKVTVLVDLTRGGLVVGEAVLRLKAHASGEKPLTEEDALALAEKLTDLLTSGPKNEQV